MAKRPRSQSDESYVIDLCDQVLELTALRQHRFDYAQLSHGTGRRLTRDVESDTRALRALLLPILERTGSGAVLPEAPPVGGRRK